MTPQPVARQAPLSMVFPRQEYWSRLPFPSPGDLPEIKPGSSALQTDSLPSAREVLAIPGMSVEGLRDTGREAGERWKGAEY